jgi:hypothetical protein
MGGKSTGKGSMGGGGKHGAWVKKGAYGEGAGAARHEEKVRAWIRRGATGKGPGLEGTGIRLGLGYSPGVAKRCTGGGGPAAAGAGTGPWFLPWRWYAWKTPPPPP